MSTDPRKRSRFDQTEQEPSRKSRFDRRSRSRSPVARTSESLRTRSPGAGGAASPSTRGDKTKLDPAAAAAAAAARINAQIQAKKGVQQADVPPIRAVSYTKPSIVLYLTIFEGSNSYRVPWAWFSDYWRGVSARW